MAYYYPQVYTKQPMPTQTKSSLDNFNNDWASGLCECFKNPKLCLCAFCCAPCFSCMLAKAAHESMCTVCGLNCLTYTSPGNIGLAMLRTKLRSIYKIDGSVCGDCLVASCCPCCTALQSYSELQYRREI